MRLRAQPLEVVHEPVAGKLRVLVVHADVDRFFGADLLAVAAEHAPEFVDLVDERVAVPLFVLAGHELDAVRRTNLGAEAARDALGAPLLVGEHPVRPAPPLGQRPVAAALFLGVLHRHLGPPEVTERQGHALEGGAEVRRLGPRALHHFHADRHQARSSATDPATMRPRSSRNSSGTRSTTFRANSASAKRLSYVQPSWSCRNHSAVAMTVR